MTIKVQFVNEKTCLKNLSDTSYIIYDISDMIYAIKKNPNKSILVNAKISKQLTIRNVNGKIKFLS